MSHSSSTNSHSPYPHLFTPLDFGCITLPNQLIMGSMHTRLEHQEYGIEKTAAFYAERARADVGLIITAAIAPSEVGNISPGSLKMCGGDDLPMHRRITGTTLPTQRAGTANLDTTKLGSTTLVLFVAQRFRRVDPAGAAGRIPGR